MESAENYILKKTIEAPRFIARVFSPVLTEDERNRRMKAIHNASANLLKDVERSGYENKKQNIT